MKKIPELLSPAGSPGKLKAAIKYGADAVYLSGRSFGMRSAASNFSVEELYESVKFAHSQGVKVYVTVNTMPRWDEYEQLTEYLCELNETGADALIIADIGVLNLAKRNAPNLQYHISTQAGAVSHADCNAWYELGASRVVLARELSLDDIREIKQRINENLELEVFVHGSMCVSWSGRCLLSSALIGRDPNRGMCAQPCRWQYKMYAESGKKHVNGDDCFLRVEIEESSRPGVRFPVEENELGTFIMSSKDLCMIEHIDDLCESGIDSLKIEGRMKSEYYAAVTANAYRMALDGFAKCNEKWRSEPKLLDELGSVSHREYCTGYFYDKTVENSQLVNDISVGYIRDKAFVATAISYDSETGIGKFVQRNKIFSGDTVELVSPGEFSKSFVVRKLYDENMKEIASIPHPSMVFYADVPFKVSEGDMLRKG